MPDISKFDFDARNLKGGGGGRASSTGGRDGINSGVGGFNNGGGAPLNILSKVLIGVIVGLFGICALALCFYGHSRKLKKLHFQEDFSEESEAEELEPELDVPPDVEKPSQTVEELEPELHVPPDVEKPSQTVKDAV